MKEKGKNEQTVMLWSVNEKEPLLPYVKVAKDAPPTRGSSVSVLWNGVKGVFARALKERKGRRTCRSWWLKRGLPRTGQRTGHCPTSLLRVCTLCLPRRQSRTHTHTKNTTPVIWRTKKGEKKRGGREREEKMLVVRHGRGAEGAAVSWWMTGRSGSMALSSTRRNSVTKK